MFIPHTHSYCCDVILYFLFIPINKNVATVTVPLFCLTQRRKDMPDVNTAVNKYYYVVVFFY